MQPLLLPTTCYLLLPICWWYPQPLVRLLTFSSTTISWRRLEIFLALAVDWTVDKWATITAFLLLDSHLSAVIQSVTYSASWEPQLLDLSSRFRPCPNNVLSAFSFNHRRRSCRSIHVVGFTLEADMADCCSSSSLIHSYYSLRGSSIAARCVYIYPFEESKPFIHLWSTGHNQKGQ